MSFITGLLISVMVMYMILMPFAGLICYLETIHLTEERRQFTWLYNRKQMYVCIWMIFVYVITGPLLPEFPGNVDEVRTKVKDFYGNDYVIIEWQENEELKERVIKPLYPSIKVVTCDRLVTREIVIKE